jgi:hypothetical protein
MVTIDSLVEILMQDKASWRARSVEYNSANSSPISPLTKRKNPVRFKDYIGSVLIKRNFEAYNIELKTKYRNEHPYQYREPTEKISGIAALRAIDFYEYNSPYNLRENYGPDIENAILFTSMMRQIALKQLEASTFRDWGFCNDDEPDDRFSEWHKVLKVGPH